MKSLCKWQLPFSIRLPSISLQLPTLKLPVFSLELPDFGISIHITIPLPSISLKLPTLHLPFVVLPPCPLDLVEDDGMDDQPLAEAV